MPKKFDTNPLDPDFPERARQQQTVGTGRQKQETETTKLPLYAEAEMPTRTLDETEFKTHDSAFENSDPIASYQTSRLKAEAPRDRRVTKVGLPENVLTALPYVPFYVGMVAGVLELLFTPKSETKVRFHAAQGLAAHIGIFVVSAILGVAGKITDLADFGNVIFQVSTFIMLIIFTIKAYQGKPIHIESVDALTEWLEDKFKPQS